MKKAGKRLQKGDTWLRKPISEEDLKELGKTGWAVLFVYLGGRKDDDGHRRGQPHDPRQRQAFRLLGHGGASKMIKAGKTDRTGQIWTLSYGGQTVLFLILGPLPSWPYQAHSLLDLETGELDVASEANFEHPLKGWERIV